MSTAPPATATRRSLRLPASPPTTRAASVHPQRPAAVDAVPQPAAAGPDLAAYVKGLIRACLSRALKAPEADIEADIPFSEYGLESILTTSFVLDVSNRLNIPMNQAIVFDHTTINRLTDYVIHTYRAEIESTRRTSVAPLASAQPPVTAGTLPVAVRTSALVIDGRLDRAVCWFTSPPSRSQPAT